MAHSSNIYKNIFLFFSYFIYCWVAYSMLYFHILFQTWKRVLTPYICISSWNMYWVNPECHIQIIPQFHLTYWNTYPIHGYMDTKFIEIKLSPQIKTTFPIREHFCIYYLIANYFLLQTLFVINSTRCTNSKAFHFKNKVVVCLWKPVLSVLPCFAVCMKPVCYFCTPYLHTVI